jgi:acyl-CoA dehydrogenase family protein 9
VRALFLGRIESADLLPFPLPPADVLATTQEVVAMVSEWAQRHVDPAAIDRAKNIPFGVIEGLKELGLFGLTIPQGYGGAGLGQYPYARVMEALAARCASTVTVLGAHLGLGIKALLLHGHEDQRRRWLPALASGERVAAFALTESGAGSDAGALRTTAERAPDGGWRLSGRKIWITNGGIANLFTVFARTPHPHVESPVHERPISAFLVPGETAGVSIGAPEAKMGLCGSSTTEVGLQDVALSAQHLIGAEGTGFKIALSVLNSGRHGLAACCIGQAKLARGLAVAHARERRQFGREIAGFGMVQELLAAMDADVYAMEAMTWLTAGLMDRGGVDTMLEAACCKMYATECLWRIANDALQITGGTGFMREYPYERILRDARINMIFEGTNQVLRLLLVSQGVKPLLDGRPADAPEAAFSGVHPALAAEARHVADQVRPLAEGAAALAARHGARVRDAQLPLRRLADMAVALFGQCAVLARASSALEGGGAREEQLTPALLALRRLELDFERARLEQRLECDALVARTARGMTGLG